MKIVKLNAIDSTNSYLKDLVRQTNVENGTVVIANFQKKGKGQNDNIWLSDKGKNLTFSVLVRFDDLKIEYQFYLNYVVSIAMYTVLNNYIPEKLSVKWPNDIMSGNQKICGILIETTFNKNNVKNAIVGVGLNVNQDDFPDEIIKATSLKKVLNTSIDKDELFDKILIEIQYQLISIKKQEFKKIKQEYEDILYKKGIPSMFVDCEEVQFLGKITGTSMTGNLLIALEDGSVKEFGIKEIRFA